jgi:DNA-binding CsgD family transcriptional regulator/PAS domain-containing protein
LDDRRRTRIHQLNCGKASRILWPQRNPVERVVPDTENDLADCVGAIYEAAANGGSWENVGARLRRLTGAQRAQLRIADRDGAWHNVMMPRDESDAIYLAYYHPLNPYQIQARRDFAEARTLHIGTVRLGPELVPDQTFLRSEYYCDFARHHERRHLLAGLVGVTEVMPLGLFRANDAKPFGIEERRILQMVLPHLQRAVELRARLGQEFRAGWATRAALDAFPISVAIVDAGLRIHFANQAARKDLAAADFGLRALRSGPHAGSGVYLAAAAKDDAAALRRLVASAVSGGSGGSTRVLNRDMSSCAVLVSPAPQGLSSDQAMPNGSGGAEKLAMVAIRDLGRAASPPAEMLCDVFGLSRAEADVATALSGGASAEDVALQRNVSLATVRSQIRSILGKSGTENLRDFERSMASLAVMTPKGPSEER